MVVGGVAASSPRGGGLAGVHDPIHKFLDDMTDHGIKEVATFLDSTDIYLDARWYDQDGRRVDIEDAFTVSVSRVFHSSIYDASYSEDIGTISDKTHDLGAQIVSGSYANDVISTGRDNDVATGFIGNDHMDGGSGDDILFGQTGADTIIGGTGHDLLFGNSGSDHLDGSRGNDLVFGGTGNDTLIGGTGNDILFGQAGRDQLDGGIGRDFLRGGTGNDTMTGGSGADFFLFMGEDYADGSYRDIITDFDFNDVIVIDVTDVDDRYCYLSDFDSIISQSRQVGDDTFINISDNDSLRLIGVRLSSLDASNFILIA